MWCIYHRRRGFNKAGFAENEVTSVINVYNRIKKSNTGNTEELLLLYMAEVERTANPIVVRVLNELTTVFTLLWLLFGSIAAYLIAFLERRIQWNFRKITMTLHTERHDEY